MLFYTIQNPQNFNFLTNIHPGKYSYTFTVPKVPQDDYGDGIADNKRVTMYTSMNKACYFPHELKMLKDFQEKKKFTQKHARLLHPGACMYGSLTTDISNLISV